MQQMELYHLLFLFLAIALEICANILLKLSNGFKRLGWGILSILAVLAAFSALAESVKGIDLSVAYALWGGFGLVATISAGWILFGQKLNTRGWLGLVTLILGMVLIKLA